MKYAGFWLRVCAAIIDTIVVNIIGSIAGFILGFGLGSVAGDTEATQSLATLLGSILGIIISWLYYALMESSPNQATLGKQALGIYVTDLNGEAISFAKATGRYFAKIISVIIIFIGFLMVAFTEKKQGLHDMIASTLVIKK